MFGGMRGAMVLQVVKCVHNFLEFQSNAQKTISRSLHYI